MSSLDHATRSLDQPKPEPVVRREPPSEDVVANDNDCIEVWPEGDPQVFARALARVLVRHALQQASPNLGDPAAVTR